ncbi:MAG TPA: hypothetical protein PKY59_17775 [Pyrinomonadaceae bacterium]|nr:hypothetical protein [Pyrinomonadaceae bacterium]
MKKLLLLMLICASVQGISAQRKVNIEGEKQRKEIISEERRTALSEMLERKSKDTIDTESLLSVTDVGEPDSFGKNAKFLGTATSGFVYIYYSCDPAVLLAELDLTLGADDRCLALPTPGQSVNATFNDIGRIKIPKNSADNVIYFIQSNLVNYDLTNPNSNTVFSNFSYSPTYTIESDALNDPAAIDPTTGLPMNGSFTTGVGGSQFVSKTFAGGGFETILDRFSSSATRGFARSYFADLGLPQNVINKLYNKPMTIKLNLRVRANFVTFGQFGYSVRFLGN